MFLGNCATIFHSLNDSVATTYIPNMAGITPIKNTTRVLVQASCVLHAYSEGDFSREILQVNNFISYLDWCRSWLDPKLGFIKQPPPSWAFQQRRLNRISSRIYIFQGSFKGTLLSNSSLRPRTRSWLYFPPTQQNHVNPLTKPRQPINKTTSTKNPHQTFFRRNITMDMKFCTPK